MSPASPPAQASTQDLVAHVCTATASTVEVQEMCHQRAVQLLEDRPGMGVEAWPAAIDLGWLLDWVLGKSTSFAGTNDGC